MTSPFVSFLLLSAVLRKIRTAKRLVPCDIEGKRLVIQQPVQFVSSLEAISSFYKEAKRGSQVILFSARIEVDESGLFASRGQYVKVVELKKASSFVSRKLSSSAPDSDSDDLDSCDVDVDVSKPSSTSSSSSSYKMPEGDDNGDEMLLQGANFLIEEAEQDGFSSEPFLTTHSAAEPNLEQSEDPTKDLIWQSAAAFVQNFGNGIMGEEVGDGEDGENPNPEFNEVKQMEQSTKQHERGILQQIIQEKSFSNDDLDKMAEHLQNIDGSGSTGFLCREEVVSEATLNHSSVLGNIDFQAEQQSTNSFGNLAACVKNQC